MFNKNITQIDLDETVSLKATKQPEKKFPDKMKSIYLEPGQVIIGVFGKYR